MSKLYGGINVKRISKNSVLLDTLIDNQVKHNLTYSKKQISAQVVEKTYSNLVSNRIISVMPAVDITGFLFYLGDKNEPVGTIKKQNFKIQPKVMTTLWDKDQDHLALCLCSELDKTTVDCLSDNAGVVDHWDYKSDPAGTHFDHIYDSLYYKILNISHKVQCANRYGLCNWIIAPRKIAAFLNAKNTTFQQGLDIQNATLKYVGTFDYNCKWDLYENNQSTDEILLGFKAASALCSGMFYIPYVFNVNPITNNIITLADGLLLNSDFYAKIKISNFP